MNTIKKFPFLVLMAIGLFINSCVQDDEFALPPVNCNDLWQSNLTITQLFEQVEADGDILTFDSDQVFEGYVISSDSTGNFFKTVSIQDHPTNPTRGLQVEMDRPNLFNNFPIGSKVKVNLKGINAGYDGHLLKVGQTYEDDGVIRVGRMAEYIIDMHVIKTCDDNVEIVPTVFSSIEDAIESGVLNTLVTIQNVQFGTIGVTYADAVNQQTVNRILVGASQETNDQSIILRNSGFADFAGTMVPEGSGSITAVFSKFGSDYQLFIRDTGDVQFNNPRYISTGGGGSGPIGGTAAEYNACLTEDFSSFAVNNQIFPEYINDAFSGNRYWQVKEFSNNKYIQMSAFNSTDPSNITYFIVPVNFTDADSFSFKTKDGFNNGAALKVYYSTDYTIGGNISDATLVDITSSFTISSGNTSGYGTNFINSGDYSLSSLNGNGAIIFKYEGSDAGTTTTMQIDDIKITDNENPSCN